MELAVIADLGVRLQRVAAVERDDVGVDFEGRDGGGGFWELIGDEYLGASVLEQEEHEGVPNHALHNHNLHHQIAGEVAVHGSEERDSHD